MKKYKDHNRPKGMCYDCKLKYGTFPDMTIDNNLWEQINPTYHKGAGILCPTCISIRLKELGVGPIQCTIHT
jgi:hypothetical protein